MTIEDRPNTFEAPTDLNAAALATVESHEASARSEIRVELPRKFGFWTGLFVVVASMVGMGILTTSGFILRDTGSPTVMLSLWAVGGLLALAGALTVAELATAMPNVGGEYIYVREAFGPATAFVLGWATLVLGFAGPIALLASTAVSYTIPLDLLLGVTSGDAMRERWITTGAASLLVIVFTIWHCLGHIESAWMQAATTMFKVLTLLGLAVGGLLVGEGSWTSFETARPFADQHAGLLGMSLVYVMYAYSGWNGAAYLAGEVRDPPKLLPRCIIGGCLLVTAFYLLLNVAYSYALTAEELAPLNSEQLKPVAELAAKKLFGVGIARPLSMVIGLGVLASLSAYILTGPRVTFAMAHDGLFPRFAAQLHATRQTPVGATLALGTVSLLLLWSGTFGQLLDFTSVGLTALATLMVASIFPLRRRASYQPTFRVPLYPIPPILFLAITAWMVAASIYDSKDPIPPVLGVLSILVGIPLYYVCIPKKSR